MQRAIEINNVEIGNQSDDQNLFRLADLFSDEADAKKETLQSKMDLIVEEIASICELDDKAISKLKVAAKGAVEKSMATFEKDVKNMIDQWGVLNQGFLNNVQAVDDFDESNDGENTGEPDREDSEEDDDIDASEVFNVNQKAIIESYIQSAIQNVEFNFSSKLPERQKIWTTTLDSILTEEQKQKLTDAQAVRDEKNQQAVVAAFIARADMELKLNDDQREKVIAYVGKKYGKIILQVETDPRRNMFGRMSNQNNPGIDQELTDILTESQQKVWKGSTVYELQSYQTIVQQFNAMDGVKNADDEGRNGGIIEGVLDLFGF
ncbi:MAG: hypothetical protein R3C03_16630 [Pirellulaceae bacterium]